LLAMNTGGDQGGETTRSAVHAAESALPYLIRLADWDSALSVIQAAFTRDASPPTVAQLLPTARHLVDVVSDEWKNLLARRIWTRLLQYADPAKGLAEGRRLFADLQAAQRHDLVRVVASDLVNAYLLAGQFADAEEISANLREYSRQAGADLGDRFNAEKSQVLVLVGQGRYEDVLGELDRVLAMADELDAIGDASGEGDLSASREVLWSAGYQSAMGLDRSEQALEYLGKVAESQKRRNVPEHLSARTRFNMYGPLIQLGRLDEAADVLTRCREHFEEHGDLPRVGKVLSALATVEHERGHDDVALSLERDALRLKYVSSASVTDIAIGHHGYGNYIPDLPQLTFAHHLAAALLFSLSGSGHLKTSFQALTEDLTDHADAAEAFVTPSAIVHEVDQVDGVRLGQLLDSLFPDTSARQRALDSILATVRARLA
jgi:tetratricopeptide (TPR) repeat protein